MSLGLGRRRTRADAAVIAYVAWRGECTAVHNAYTTWVGARGVDAEVAYLAYEEALDREQAAADVYAGLMRKVGHLVEAGLDYPLRPSFRYG